MLTMNEWITKKKKIVSIYKLNEWMDEISQVKLITQQEGKEKFFLFCIMLIYT